MKNIKNKIMIIIMLAFMFGLVIGCNSVENGSKELEVIDKTMEVGEVVKLTVASTEWTVESSDEKIVSVSKEGIIKALSQGKATVYVKDNSSVQEINVTVNDSEKEYYLKVEGKQTLVVNEEVSLVSVVLNSDESIVYEYLSNDTNVCTVTSAGVLKGITTGLATITIKAIGTDFTLEKEMLIYVHDENEESKIINNIIENKVYEVTGTIDLTSINKNVLNIVETYKDSIVGVSNYQYYTSQAQKELVEMGVGTGVIFKKTGTNGDYTYYVLTNHHVIEDSYSVKVYFGYEDKYVDAEVLASSSSLDLAVVTFKSSETFTLVPLGTVEDLSVGDFAIAIGNANGYEYFGSVTFGVISYVNRVLTGESSTFIQHDVAINPGNSGGPLFDINGKVIGINTLKIVDTDVDNIGFAISIEVVKEYLKSLNIID